MKQIGKQLAITVLAAAPMLGAAHAQAAAASAAPVTATATRTASSGRPQQHFIGAVAAYARTDYKAAQAWARNDYHQAGHGLEAATHALRGAAGWSGKQAKAAASATLADARALGDKLVSGAAFTRDEVVKGIEALGNGVDKLGRGAAGTKTAAPLT